MTTTTAVTRQLLQGRSTAERTLLTATTITLTVINKGNDRCGASIGGSKSNIFNPSLGSFLYHILHTMSLWRHKSIRNNTNNQQTPPPWWWSRSPLQRGGFDDTTQPEGRAALRMFTPRPLLKDFVYLLNKCRNQYIFINLMFNWIRACPSATMVAKTASIVGSGSP